ncbi:MAG TPA: hypothetical protein VKZ42_01410 [Flavobacteriaceae bacterium]|nr:hypothetical protein [Flavobacteriaceae bacterium]
MKTDLVFPGVFWESCGGIFCAMGEVLFVFLFSYTLYTLGVRYLLSIHTV